MKDKLEKIYLQIISEKVGSKPPKVSRKPSKENSTYWIFNDLFEGDDADCVFHKYYFGIPDDDFDEDEYEKEIAGRKYFGYKWIAGDEKVGYSFACEGYHGFGSQYNFPVLTFYLNVKTNRIYHLYLNYDWTCDDNEKAYLDIPESFDNLDSFLIFIQSKKMENYLKKYYKGLALGSHRSVKCMETLAEFARAVNAAK